jgi:hypothetical protein
VWCTLVKHSTRWLQDGLEIIWNKSRSRSVWIGSCFGPSKGDRRWKWRATDADVSIYCVVSSLPRALDARMKGDRCALHVYERQTQWELSVRRVWWSTDAVQNALKMLIALDASVARVTTQASVYRALMASWTFWSIFMRQTRSSEATDASLQSDRRVYRWASSCLSVTKSVVFKDNGWGSWGGV